MHFFMNCLFYVIFFIVNQETHFFYFSLCLSLDLIVKYIFPIKGT